MRRRSIEKLAKYLMSEQEVEYLLANGLVLDMLHTRHSDLLKQLSEEAIKMLAPLDERALRDIAWLKVRDPNLDLIALVQDAQQGKKRSRKTKDLEVQDGKTR